MWEEENFHLERSLRAGEAIEKTVAPRQKNDFEGWGGTMRLMTTLPEGDLPPQRNLCQVGSADTCREKKRGSYLAVAMSLVLTDRLSDSRSRCIEISSRGRGVSWETRFFSTVGLGNSMKEMVV